MTTLATLTLSSTAVDPGGPDYPDTPLGFALDPTDDAVVLQTEYGRVLRLPSGATAATTLATLTTDSNVRLNPVVDGDGNTFLEAGDQGLSYELYEVPAAGGTPADLATVPGQPPPDGDLALDANGNLYGTYTGVETPRHALRGDRQPGRPRRIHPDTDTDTDTDADAHPRPHPDCDRLDSYRRQEHAGHGGHQRHQGQGRRGRGHPHQFHCRHRKRHGQGGALRHDHRGGRLGQRAARVGLEKAEAGGGQVGHGRRAGPQPATGGRHLHGPAGSDRPQRHRRGRHGRADGDRGRPVRRPLGHDRGRRADGPLAGQGNLADGHGSPTPATSTRPVPGRSRSGCRWTA